MGKDAKLDALGVDSGYRSQVVYAWTRANEQINPLAKGARVVLALKGGHGWDRPAIGLPATLRSISAESVCALARRFAPCKSTASKAAPWLTCQRGVKSGKPSDPGNDCHFPDWLDETYFKQLTENIATNKCFEGGRNGYGSNAIATITCLTCASTISPC